jgi:hypothetical protein
MNKRLNRFQVGFNAWFKNSEGTEQCGSEGEDIIANKPAATMTSKDS